MNSLALAPTDSDRTMLRLLVGRYVSGGFDACVLEFGSTADEHVIGYKIHSKSGDEHEFWLQKFNRGIFKKLWTIAHARQEACTYTYVYGLANALGECENLMAGRSPTFSSMHELAHALARQ